MRYKGKFAGTMMFCNETRKFYPCDDRVKAKLEEHTLCIAPSQEEYEKAMKDCVARHLKFNGQVEQVIFHSNLSPLDAIQEIHNIANEIKEMD